MSEKVVWLYDEEFRSFDPSLVAPRRPRMGRLPSEAQAKFIADAWTHGALIGTEAAYWSKTEAICFERGWLMPYEKKAHQKGDFHGIFVPSPAGLRALAAFLLKAEPSPRSSSADRGTR